MKTCSKLTMFISPISCFAVALLLLAMTGCSQPADSGADSNTTSDGTAETDKEKSSLPDMRVPVVDPDDPNFELEPGFRLLTLDDLEIFHGKPPGPDLTWSQFGQTLVCLGTPRGYAYTKENYDDFTLRCDYKFVPAADQKDGKKLANSNTGFLVYINGEHKLWPVSLEVQGKHVEMGQIKANGGAAAVTIQDDESVRESARKPVGQWNSIEIISKDGTLTTMLNGQQVCQSEPGELKSGLLGFQSEDYEVHYRNLRIKAPPKFEEIKDDKLPF